MKKKRERERERERERGSDLQHATTLPQKPLTFQPLDSHFQSSHTSGRVIDDGSNIKVASVISGEITGVSSSCNPLLVSSVVDPALLPMSLAVSDGGEL